jgi:hypothetical protein
MYARASSFWYTELTAVCSVIRALHNIVYVGEHEHGGHFSAHEQPLALASDVRKMFAKGGPAYGVVAGKTGY